MYTRKRGDMWSMWAASDLFLITTNSCTQAGKLVMGAGIAREAAGRFPGLDRALGSKIDHLQVYGLLTSPRWPDRKLGLFQTKCHWKKPALPLVIHLAADQLAAWCREHPDKRVDLNFPGIGCGGLTTQDVRPLLKRLPPAVRVWTRR